MSRLIDRMMAFALAALMILQPLSAGAAAGDSFAGWQEAISDVFETADYHTVRFETEEETLLTLFVADGAAVADFPAVPEKAGKRFIGWYAEGKRITDQTPVTGDLTVLAVYTSVASNLDEKKANADYLYSDSGDYVSVSIFGYHKKNQKPSAHVNYSVAGDSTRTVLEAWTVDSIKNNTDLSVETVVTALPELAEGETLAAYTVIDNQLVTLIQDDLKIGDRIALNLAFKGAKGIAIVKVAEPPVQLVDNGALWANADIYLTGKIPGNGIVEAIPVTVDIDGEEVLAAYDINIYANEKQRQKGKTWQPADKKVQLHFYNEAFGSDELNVYHMETITSQPELVESVSALDGWITFDAESFSVYAVTKSIEKTVSIDGATYKITLNYDSRAGIPEGAELAVTEIPDDDYLAETAAVLNWSEDDTVFYTKFLDISIIKDGMKIEPQTPVQVIVELLDADAAAEAMEVVHFGGNGAEKVESTVTAEGMVIFTADSFSVFGFGSILRTLLNWTSDAVTYSLQGLSSLLRPAYTAIDVSLEEGLEAINAYTVSCDSLLGRLVNLWVKVGADMELGSREQLVVYSVKNEEIDTVLAKKEETGDMTVSLADSEGFALVLDTGYRRKYFETENVVLNGMMPKASEAEILPAAPELEGELLAAYDITIREDEDEYQPDTDHPVDVAITSAGIAEAEELHVWHILDDGTGLEITDFTVEGDTVRFIADGFSVYAVTQTVLTQNLVASDGNVYAIEVIYHNTAGIPMTGTELLVSELLSGDEGYGEYVENTVEKLGAKAENLDFARIFDIRIVDRDDHDLVYEPIGDVEVNIRLIGEALNDYENIGVLHFVEGEEDDAYTIYEMETSVNGEAVEFTTDSFSIYVVAGYTLEKVVEASDGNTYKITLTYERDAELPDGAELEVVELHGEAYAEYVGRTAVVLDAAGFDYARVFDISIVDGEGAKYQPAVPVQVSIQLLDAESNSEAFSVVHFDEISEESEQVAAATEGNVVTFSASGFSAYAIVTGPQAVPLWWTKVSSVDELAELSSSGVGFYMSHIDGYYYTNSITQINATRTGITKTKPPMNYPSETAKAAMYYFEFTSGKSDQVKVYCLNGDAKQYIVQSSNSLNLTEDPEGATPFTIEPFGNAANTFRLKGGDGFYCNMQGGANGASFAAWNNAGDNNNKIYLWYYITTDSDPYGLDGKSYGLMNWNGGVSGRAMMASSLSGNALEALPLTVMAKAVKNEDKLFVPNNSEISMWTFKWIDGDSYYVTASVDGSTRYLKVEENGLALVNTPDDACKLQVVPGTGAHTGEICLKANNTTLTYSGTVEKGFKTGGSAGSEWLKLVELSELTPEYFMTYSASKVSVSDLNVTNGSRIIVYTRTWDDTKKKYVFYAIDHDGTLVPCYESGDSIQWIGGRINTLLWNFVEYYWEGTNDPNYYYEMYNQYSEKYIAPQVSGGQILANDNIGINMTGRRNGYYYSNIVAWDEGNYAYAGLKVEDGKVVSCPLFEADDFYFAVMQDIPVDDVLHMVPTVDHTQYGITMKIVDFGTKVNGYNEADTFFASNAGGAVNYTQPNLLSTDLGRDGYPKNSKGESMKNLYSKAQEVNHLFIASTYSGSGYFEFDSSQNFASLDTNTGYFTVYKELGTMDGDNKNSLKHGQFMPFNNLEAGVFSSANPKNLYDATLKQLPDSDPRKYEQMYLVRNPDYYFGVEIEASFTQTANGLDDWGHDIIYEFTGDDDFWLYVDGELVIDLGGIHSALPGSVNFSTGAVNVNGTKTTLRALYEANYRGRKPGATDEEVAEFLGRYFDEGKTIFKDYTTHTMRIFYMERGAGASNLHMRFNLASVKPGTVELTKKLDGVDSTESVLAEFPYQIYYRKKDNLDREILLEQGDLLNRIVYYINTVSLVTYKSELHIDGMTYKNVFMLKPGETAVIDFPDADNVYDYRIVECGVNNKVYSGVTVNGQAVEETET
ncbi:MAG: hypothetical protein IJ214_01555, partial [Clostridia bacterium]|nr:hypothetical protein [Clostridia bacterium]